MKFKTGIEQSVYILLILGRVPNDYSITSEDISERLKLSSSYTKKLMKLLVHEGLIKSTTGKKGGFALAKPLSEIDLSNIFNAVEGRGSLFSETDLVTHLIGEENSTQKKCSLKIVMDTIEESWKAVLQKVNLEELEKKIEQEYDTTNIDEWINKVTVK